MTNRNNHGGRDRKQGRKADFPGLSGDDLSRITVPTYLKEAVKEIAKKVYTRETNGDRLASRRALDNVEPGHTFFSDVEMPASFGKSVVGTDTHEIKDLNEWVTQNHASSVNPTFLIKATGDSMTRAGIFPQDLLVVEALSSSLIKPVNGDIVIARVEGSVTVKKFFNHGGSISLIPDSLNPIHTPVVISGDDLEQLEIFGIVRFIVHDPRNQKL